MAALTTQNIVNAGTAPTFAAAGTSDTAEVADGKSVIVHYKNVNAASRTITITVAGNNSYGQANPDPVLTLAADTGELLIPMRKEYGVDGRATLTPSDETDVTVAVYRIQS